MSSGEDVVTLRRLDVDLVADRELRKRLLEGGVAEARADAEHAALGRRGDGGEVTAQAPLVLVSPVGQLDPEVLAGTVVDLLFLQVGDDEPCALRDLTGFLDERAHARRLLFQRGGPLRFQRAPAPATARAGA